MTKRRLLIGVTTAGLLAGALTVATLARTSEPMPDAEVLGSMVTRTLEDPPATTATTVAAVAEEAAEPDPVEGPAPEPTTTTPAPPLPAETPPAEAPPVRTSPAPAPAPPAAEGSAPPVADVPITVRVAGDENAVVDVSLQDPGTGEVVGQATGAPGEYVLVAPSEGRWALVVAWTGPTPEPEEDGTRLGGGSWAVQILLDITGPEPVTVGCDAGGDCARV
jgi:outer membrane biosynthesis protein TonB